MCVREDGTASIWGVDPHEELYRLTGHRDRVWDVAVAGDGCRVVTGGIDGTVRVWRTEQTA